MKCPRCSWITEETVTFCKTCGVEMVPTPSCPIVICNGRLKDKSPCNAELSNNKNFCHKCGKKVNQLLFTRHHSNTCPMCNTALDPGCINCPQCGLSQDWGQNNTHTAADSNLIPQTDNATGEGSYQHTSKKLVFGNAKHLNVGQNNPIVHASTPAQTSLFQINSNSVTNTGTTNEAYSTQETHKEIEILQGEDENKSKVKEKHTNEAKHDKTDGAAKHRTDEIGEVSEKYETDHSNRECQEIAKLSKDQETNIILKVDVQTDNSNVNNIDEIQDKEERKVPENAIHCDKANTSNQHETGSEEKREEKKEILNDQNTNLVRGVIGKSTEKDNYNNDPSNEALKENICTDNGMVDEGTCVDTGTSSRKLDIDLKKEELATNINKTTNEENPKTADGLRDNSQNTSNGNTQPPVPTEKYIHVVFHVLVSEDFKFDPEKQKLILKIGNYFGGWQNNDKVLKFKRTVLINIAEMELELYFPAKLITGDSKLYYKYCVIDTEKFEKDGKSKPNTRFFWENYSVNKETGKRANRILTIPNVLTGIENWNQYDGFVEKKPKGVVDRILDWVSWNPKLIAHARMTVKVFCSAMFESGHMERCLQSPFEQLENVIICVRNIYYVHGKCWDNNEDKFKKEIGNYLVTTIFEKIKDETGLEMEHRIVWSFAVLQVVRQIEIELENTNVQLLCKALLMKPDVEKRTCIELQYADKHYSNQQLQKTLKEAFVYFGGSIAKTTKDPSWLYIMPWIHFLSKASKPFQAVDNDLAHDERIPVWWGTTQIGEDSIEQFKGKQTRWSISIEHVLNELYPLFEMDYLLPRTFMSVVEIDDLKSVVRSEKISLEVCIAAVIYYLKANKPAPYHHYDKTYFCNISTGEKKVHECVVTLREQLQARSTSGSDQPKQWQCVYMFASQMLHEAIEVNRSNNLVQCAHALIHSLAIYDCTVGETGKHPSGEQASHLSVLNESVEKIVKWLDMYGLSFGQYLERDMLVWNNLLASNQLQSEKVRDEWNKRILESFSDRLQRKSFEPGNDTTNFVTLYCKKVDEYQPCMRNILSKYAFKAITAAYAVDTMHFSDAEKRNFGKLLSDMFNTAWQKQSSIEQCTQSVLKHVMTWTPFLQFLKIYYKDEHNIQLLSPECTERLVKGVTAIEISVQHLLEGSLTIGTLKLIGSTGSIFPALAYQLSERFTVAYISKAIDIRKKEFAAFEIQAQQMSNLSTLCQDLPKVDTHSIDAVLKKCNDIDSYQLNDFCHPALVNETQEVKDSQPQVNAFPVPDSVLQILPSVQKCYCSKIFMKLWRRECLTIKDTCSTFDKMVQHVWRPVQSCWFKVADEIRSGDIHFEEFEQLIEQLAKEDYEKIHGELQTLNLDKCVIVERIEQLKRYRHINTCVNGAKLILDFAEQYKLTGDFEQIRIVANHVYTDFEMRSFDNNLMNVCADLQSLTPKRAHCLEMLVICGALVNWLQESMKESGLKELKVFVDLAFMSAGDEPINIQRVQCLHAAVTGYAPLIFDLKHSSDHKELLRLCQFVWTELDADPKLPKKLKDTNDGLEWLKEIKKAHGSVEVTSLVQTEIINSTGKYTVGKGAVPQNSKFQMLCDTLKLEVREDGDGSAYRNYTFSQLQDLESRLMLVAGKDDKNNEGIERFTMIFDSVTRLSDLYIKLCAAGCVLFKHWTATFLCDPTILVCAILAFGEGVDAPKLKARKRDGEDTLRETIPHLAKFMETCLEEWIEYIKDMRKRHFHLNYFTVDQLVILQRELVKLGTAEEPSHLVYPLLSAIKHNCTKDDVTSAMSAVKTELEPDADTDEPDSLEDGNKTSCTDSSSSKVQEETRNANILSFIQELVTAGYDRSLAVKATGQMSKDFSDPECTSDGVLWCMDHCDDDEEQISDAETEHSNSEGKDYVEYDADDQEQHFNKRNTSNLSVQAMIDSNISMLVGDLEEDGTEPLLRNLKQLWEQFIESITSNIPDYLNLEHLGLILKNLFQNETSCIDRTIPSGYYEGKPNLIICSPGDVLNTVLSLYMLERDQPLPQSDEILMCTEQTTIDEVDIFWRRALFGRERKIHCLLNADLLQFEVSENAEKCLEQYILETNCKDTNYRLFVLCGSDNEYRSRIVSFLDKYRRPPLPVNKIQLREHLALKLRIGKQAYGVKPAATVDTDRSSVRLIKSWRSGVGKTLYKERREAALVRLNNERIQADNVTISLQEKHIDMHYVIERFLEYTDHPEEEVVPRIFHLDLAYEVHYGVDHLLFNLLILGCLMDTTGYVWRKSSTDLYLIETMPLVTQTSNQRVGECQYVHQILSILPDMTCRSPLESLDIYHGIRPRDFRECDQLFDRELFESPIYQRPLQYLLRQDRTINLQNINPKKVKGTPELCIQTLLRHCGIQDPSWSELHHFVWFLNTQLCDFEENSFVSVAAAQDLPGFSDFVLRSLIQMSRDFSTRSLKMSEESPGIVYNKHADTIEEEINGDDADTNVDENEEVLQGYQMRRTWESSPHPYLFFNSDKTFTFLGFNIERTTRNLIDQQTGQILEKGIMSKPLYESLIMNKANLQENFDDLNRNEKIEKLCSVMGIDKHRGDPDPDSTYELTTDNVKKILAIYMRFRCDIPVIIMGETGCGKTRLIKFMCALQTRPGINVQNMILMKVHGGTTNKDIIRTVLEAEKIARKNVAMHGKHVFTVLFFDEANTTESIGLIKEIMCDKRMEGKRLDLCENLKMVAACNPYKKHSDELIRKLEQAGLGYHVDADETTDRLGSVPMRRLVYRVQPLPQSLLPLVWDFGQLNTDVEDLYIRQMVRRYINDERLPSSFGLVKVLSSILTASQDYMRMQKNECSFVSLRDVDRVLNIMSWFYHQSRNRRTLFDSMDDKVRSLTTPDDLEHSDVFSEPDDSDETEPDENVIERKDNRLDDITRSLVLALGVCYHACLKTRSEYRDHISLFFENPFNLPGGAEQIENEIVCCQDVFLDNVQLDKNIARNMALKENVFMMIVCIELRIPLFLVGKPGSSKSLAKTIVSDAMQGKTARGDLFKKLKQVQMVSFQCSPLSTPDGIIGTFRQCAQFQKDKDLDSFVSIVVLDEVGLAEDSPRMPLKTLHPLLEDGCQGDETPEDYKKVAFVGISNWALDPAKMNRGILVQRDVPDTEELQNSARGICSSEEDSLRPFIEPLIEPMAISYLKIFEEASENMREFFGLRDFYSLVKMIYSFVEKSRTYPTWHQMMHAIKRNFGGLDQFDPVESFRQNLPAFVHISNKPSDGDPDCTSAGLINACLFDISNTLSESRYLLLLIENYGALTILQQQILARQSHTRPITIFGSSFRRDQEYTQVCRNINKIKVCMETGKTVVLLNLENLYESLYDALNQYYVYFGGERYVDLGLGTHRVKCPVHRDFRLIVVAEKQTVYKKFPIPLINRLEKHFLTVNTMLSPAQQNVVAQLVEWAKQCAKLKLHNTQAYRNESMPRDNIGDVFMGYYDDTCSAIVLHVWNICNGDDADPQVVLHEAKAFLLWCATPDAITQLEKNMLHGDERDEVKTIYWKEQTHDNIVQYLRLKIIQEECKPLFAQVTTHSKLLSSYHKKDLSKETGIELTNIMLLDTLSSFDTEQQFSNKIRNHLKRTNKDPGLILIQCDSWDVNTGLVACARYCVMEEYQNMHDELEAQVHIVFVIQLQRGRHFTGFQCGVWHSVHIDDICNNDDGLPAIQDMQGKSVGQLMYDAVVTQKVNIKANENLEIQTCDNGVPHINPDEPAVEGLLNTTNDFVQYPSSDQNMSPSKKRSGVPSSTETVPLQLDSMEAQFKRAQCISGATETRDTGGTKLNVRRLILACVQSALSMVRDKDENSTRTTDRVPLVLKLFHKNTKTDDKSFLEGVSVILACLLNEKEAHAQMFMSTRELVDEAAKCDVIHKAGTFRRSCLKIVEMNISPVLAGIIAYLDTNQNLSILHNDRSWKHKLWLSFLNTPKALGLQYSDLQSPNRQSDLQEAVVMTTGCEDHVFQCHMPFSWLIYGQINAILKSQDLETEGDESGTEDIYVRVLGDTSLGMLLKQATDYVIVSELVQEYIHDFVHIMYNAHSDNEHAVHLDKEHEFVTECVAYATGQMKADIREDSILHTLIYVHLAYKSLTLHLAYFRTMNQVWPECSSKILEPKHSTQICFSLDEDKLQGGIGHPHWFLVVLCMLIENLTPVRNELNDPAGRSEWLQKVHQYRPVVEKAIDLIHTYNSDNVGTSAQRVRCLWSRVVVMKLFLEHVCTTCDEDKITFKYCMPFWSLLGEKTNLKNVKSLENVEKFLKNCSKAASKLFEKKVHRCCNCEEIKDASLIVLPCTHLVCDLCYHEIQISDEDSKCPKCNTLINQDWSPVRQREENEAIQNIQDYQKRCNTFFMDVVSQLCFAGNSPPSDEVIKKLLEYIITTNEGGRRQVTKELTIFESGIDPTPVFRSFLLQLLMRTSEEKIKVNLEQYLSKAKDLLPEGGDNEKHYVELCLLIIQCLEDMFHQEAVKVKQDECMYATRYLRHASQVLLFTGVIKEIEVLYGLAEARAGLLLTAKQIHEIVQLQKNVQVVDRSARQLVMAANVLCIEGDLKWPRIYLVKYICRRYGINTYQTVCRSGADYLKWIGMPNINKDMVDVDTDRYLVCEDTYTEIREAVAKVVLGEDIEQLTETLQDQCEYGDDANVMFKLAIYREITCSYIYPTLYKKLSQEVLDTLDNFIQENNSVEDKDMLRALLYNHLGDGPCKHLTVMFGSSVLHQGVQSLLVHFLCVMSQFNASNTLMQPLAMLAKYPEKCANTLLPTMPQNDIEDARDALLAACKKYEPRLTTQPLYQCPNGHLYMVGDCGNPTAIAKCRDCGADIGGKNEKLLPDNIKHDSGMDKTLTGHILGRVEMRGQIPVSQRELSRPACAYMRLMTHMAMYVGAADNLQGIQMLIKPDLLPEEIPEFLWQHIMFDITDLQEALGRSDDDILLLGHTIIDKIMTIQEEADDISENMYQLKTKDGRRIWEEKFSAKYIQPILQEQDNILKTLNSRLVADYRLGKNPLLGLLNEVDEHEKEESITKIQNIPAVWRYRTLISVDHLRQALDTITTKTENMEKYKVLRLFLQELLYSNSFILPVNECVVGRGGTSHRTLYTEHYLRAIRYIPSVLKLHRALFHKYQRKLDKAEAAIITVGDLKGDNIMGTETLSILQDFADAWHLVRESLKVYVCPTDVGGMVVPREYCNKHIDDNTPICVLLPTTTKGAGLCSFAMLDFLMRKHNHFLDTYMLYSRRPNDSVSNISAMDVTSTHIINFETQHDILSLVLSNCQYSYEVGKGTNIEYDFAGLERQLMDRFLFSMSRIDVGKVLKIEQMIYRAEFTNAAAFRTLNDKITQVVLSSTVKRAICGEIRLLPELCESLNNLDIAISFLKSVGGDPDHHLNAFMEDTLKMKNSLLSHTARQMCQFRHAQSLWMILTLQKSKHLTDDRQPMESIFECVLDQYFDDLPDDVEEKFSEYMQNVSTERLSQLVELLHEYIFLHVAVRENPDDEDYTEMKDKELCVWLTVYIEGLDENAQELLPGLKDFPAEIQHRHSVCTWTTVYRRLRDRQTV